MNRSILIVICDFLLVTMLAFSNFENVNTPPEKGAPPTTPNSLTRESGIQGDLASALKMALAKSP
jgi:hypothetical protein